MPNIYLGQFKRTVYLDFNIILLVILVISKNLDSSRRMMGPVVVNGF